MAQGKTNSSETPLLIYFTKGHKHKREETFTKVPVPLPHNNNDMYNLTGVATRQRDHSQSPTKKF